jgi:hypothetical protein
VTNLSLARDGNARSRSEAPCCNLQLLPALSSNAVSVVLNILRFGMRKQLKLGAALLLTTGIFAITLPTPADAAECANGALSTLAPLAFTCTKGGFTFTLNSYSGFDAVNSIIFKILPPIRLRLPLMEALLGQRGQHVYLITLCLRHQAGC